MKTRNKKILLFLIPVFLIMIVLIVLLGKSPRKPWNIQRGDYSYAVEYAEYRLKQLLKEKNLPSVAFTLIDDQEIIWQGAFGMANREAGIPAKVDTVYKL